MIYYTHTAFRAILIVAMKPIETFLYRTFCTPEKFQIIIEEHHQALYRYYALHAKGDLRLAYTLTKETFLALHQEYPSFEKNGCHSELFGIAWDVWNARYRYEVVQTKLPKSPFETSLQPELERMLKVLRHLPFYPREILYLRFFAGVDTKDIACLMDKSDTAVKVLVYQTLMRFASGMSDTPPVILPWKQLLLLAQSYHRYLDDLLPGDGIPREALLATHQLQALRAAISMKPELLSLLIQDVEQGILKMCASVTL